MSYPQEELFSVQAVQAPVDPGEERPHDLRDAAEKTIAALEMAGGLDETHALKLALIRQIAGVLDREMSGAKITVAATSLISTMLDTVDNLPTLSASLSEQFTQLVAELGYQTP